MSEARTRVESRMVERQETLSRLIRTAKDQAIQALENIGCTTCGSEHVQVDCGTLQCYCVDCELLYDPSASTKHLQGE